MDQLIIMTVSEVVATSFLKATEGFTRLGPSIVVMIGYIGSFWCVSQTLDTIPIGVSMRFGPVWASPPSPWSRSSCTTNGWIGGGIRHGSHHRGRRGPRLTSETTLEA